MIYQKQKQQTNQPFIFYFISNEIFNGNQKKNKNDCRIKVIIQNNVPPDDEHNNNNNRIRNFK